MSEPAAPWQSHGYGILPHPHEPRILMVPEPRESDTVWTLPRLTRPRRIWFVELGWVTAAMSNLLGSAVTALRSAQFVTDEHQHHVEAIYILENRAAVEYPPLGGAWITRAQLGELRLAVPSQRSILEAYFAEIERAEPPDHRPPWAMPGWYAAVETWIHEQLEALGCQVMAPIEQVRVWGVSCVLRARTSSGAYYFKCGARLPLAANEPQLMQALGTRYPQFVPAPARFNLDQGWILLADFGPPASHAAPDAVLHSAYRALATMQVDLAATSDTLLALGCTDRRMPHLVEHLDLLLADLGRIPGLEPAEIRRLHALVPQLRERCWQLQQVGMPYSLVHGDFHAANIASHGAQALIFDWAEGCLAHPLFDMLDLFEHEDGPYAQVLRASYLAPWVESMSMATLETAWMLAKPLAALHTAVSSYTIVTHLEDGTNDQLGWSVPRWLRVVLRNM